MRNHIPWTDAQRPCLVPQGRPFVKMHGLRNDFVIVDARHRPFTPSEVQAQMICDRRQGVGADELVIVEQPSAEDIKDNIAAKVRIINTDGREVEACGNASRCVGWLLMQEHKRYAVTFRTLGGRLKCKMCGENFVSVGMGRLRTAWDEIPLSEPMDTLHLNIGAGPLQDPVGMNIGNPHAVFFVEDLDAVDLEVLGPKLQHHPLFPEEANIGVAQMLDAGTMRLAVWERPGALTTACGSGACAAVGAARRRGLSNHNIIRVLMPAGDLEIGIEGNDAVTMTGPVKICYAGYLPDMI